MTARVEPPTPAQAPTPRTGVLVIAGVRLYREGIANSLAGRNDLRVLGTAASVEEGLALVASVTPEVLLIDAAANRSFDIVQRVRKEAPGTKILAFGIEDSESDILACAEAGVAGYVLRDASMDDLCQAIASAVRGELFCPPRISASLFRRLGALAGSRDLLPGRWIALTEREREILSLLDAGLSNKQLARELHIEISTVKNHVHRVLEKLHVASRAEAVAALRTGLTKQPVITRGAPPFEPRRPRSSPSTEP